MPGLLIRDAIGFIGESEGTVISILDTPEISVKKQVSTYLNQLFIGPVIQVPSVIAWLVSITRELAENYWLHLRRNIYYKSSWRVMVMYRLPHWQIVTHGKHKIKAEIMWGMWIKMLSLQEWCYPFSSWEIDMLIKDNSLCIVTQTSKQYPCQHPKVNTLGNNKTYLNMHLLKPPLEAVYKLT